VIRITELRSMSSFKRFPKKAVHARESNKRRLQRRWHQMLRDELSQRADDSISMRENRYLESPGSH
jgi:hypothetical protein